VERVVRGGLRLLAYRARFSREPISAEEAFDAVWRCRVNGVERRRVAAMAEANSWNTKTINEFRDNHGRVGGPFEGAPLTLVHSRGRKTGREYVNPVMYLPADDDPDVFYIFATKGGAPDNPEWYYNLSEAGRGNAEVGDEAFAVTVSEVTGDERDRIYAEQARRYPGFAEYAVKTAGIRTIPVLALRRSA
jgi:deazaflavin-dependent oxidoreductase (nitroreductase family)